MSGLPLVWSNDWMASICVSGGSSLPSRLRQLAPKPRSTIAMRMPVPVEAARLQRIGADALDALRDDLVGHRHLGRADAAHAGQAPQALGEAGRVAHLQQRAGARRDRRAEPGERTADARRAPGAAAIVSELRGGAGERSAALESATPATAQSVAAASTRRRMQVHVTGRDPPVLPRPGDAAAQERQPPSPPVRSRRPRRRPGRARTRPRAPRRRRPARRRTWPRAGRSR